MRKNNSLLRGKETEIGDFEIFGNFNWGKLDFGGPQLKKT